MFSVHVKTIFPHKKTAKPVIECIQHDSPNLYHQTSATPIWPTRWPVAKLSGSQGRMNIQISRSRLHEDRSGRKRSASPITSLYRSRAASVGDPNHQLSMEHCLLASRRLILTCVALGDLSRAALCEVCLIPAKNRIMNLEWTLVSLIKQTKRRYWRFSRRDGCLNLWWWWERHLLWRGALVGG